MNLRHLTRLDAAYPARLRGFEHAPAVLIASGGSLEAQRAVAVVGSRDATRQAVKFTYELCRALAKDGVVVVSGGAIGIDAAAHRATLDAQGRTWVVAATGPGRCVPACHAALFDAIGAGPGAVLWPFAPGYFHRSAFLQRNRLLVALSDGVVVVQAGKPSGALHTAGWALRLGKPLWVVPAPPWAKRFAGSAALLESGATPLVSIEGLLTSLRPKPCGGWHTQCEGDGGRGRLLTSLRPKPCGREAGPASEVVPRKDEETNPDEVTPKEQAEIRWTEHGSDKYSNNYSILRYVSDVPQHLDQIAFRARSSAQVTAAALLTLVLENVVVEGPPGFFRRRESS